ncbi:MAG TPA: VOC family protein [Levilinea sp.]|nr:VOC family protein [Levilinea sp.]
MQKISPYLWFTDKAEEAMNFYVSLYDNSRLVEIFYYPEGVEDEHMQGMQGKVLNGIFELAGQRFMALDGGPYFQLNPSISFFVHCQDEEEIDRLYARLSPGGADLMPLQQYPFAEKYVWLQDRYGLTWQLMLDRGEVTQKIRPAMMFVGEQAGKAEEAMSFYSSLFVDSGIEMVSRYASGGVDQEGTVNHARFNLHGQGFIAMDSAFEHEFTFNEAISFYVDCASQSEVDSLWQQLSAVPEAEQCGWVKDRFGVSWQIVPSRLGELIKDPDPLKSRRVMEAMLKMKKIEVDALERAYQGG